MTLERLIPSVRSTFELAYKNSDRAIPLFDDAEILEALEQAAGVQKFEEGEFSGPNPPGDGEGWVLVRTGPKGGKYWRHETKAKNEQKASVNYKVNGSHLDISQEIKPVHADDLKKPTINLWHGTKLSSVASIIKNGIVDGDRGKNASAQVSSASQYPEDTGAQALVLLKADTADLKVDPNDQIGETVEDGLFSADYASSCTIGDHEVLAVFDIENAAHPDAAIKALGEGNLSKAIKSGAKILYQVPPKPKEAAGIQKFDTGEYHGPQPPGEGWVQIGTGPLGGKIWKHERQEPKAKEEPQSRQVREKPVEALPDDPDKYFTSTHNLVPLDKLRSVRSRPEGVLNANQFMKDALDGNHARREPIKVVKESDGTFSVADGNSTVANAKANNWKSIPVVEVSREWMDAEQVRTLNKETAKAIQKTQTGALFGAAAESLPRAATQSVKSEAGVFAAAKAAQPAFEQMLDRGKGLSARIGAEVCSPDSPAGFEAALNKPGIAIIIAPLKSEARAARKVNDDYGGDWSQLRDVVRATVAVDTVDQIPTALHAMREEMAEHGWTLAAKPKNRFEKTSSDGYRDINLSVRAPSGHICEVQINTKAMIRAKEGQGHKLYEQWQAAGDAAKGRDMTPAEKKNREKLEADMASLYDEAWKKSLGIG